MPRKKPTRLATEMKLQGISAVRVSKELKMSPWTISNAVHGQQSQETRAKLAKFLSLPPDDLGPITMQSRYVKKGFSGKVNVKEFSSPVTKARVKEALSPIAALISSPEKVPVIDPKGAIILPLQPSVDALVTALFKKRKERGYKPAEISAVNAWARKVLDDATLLRSVLLGQAMLDIDAAGAVSVDVSSPKPAALPAEK